MTAIAVALARIIIREGPAGGGGNGAPRGAERTASNREPPNTRRSALDNLARAGASTVGLFPATGPAGPESRERAPS